MAHFLNFSGDYFGLSDVEVEHHAELYGYNVYRRGEHKKPHFSVLRTLLSPAFVFMFIAGVLNFFCMNIWAGLIILFIDIGYVCAEIYVGTSADERLEEMKASTAMKFRVIRNGKLELIDKEYIVPEDIIIIQSGERVPVDAYIQEARGLMVDEKIFTGISKPVPKYVGAISKSELKPTFVYSGSTVLSGVAICKVSATGVDTKYFRTFGEEMPREYYTRLERTVHRIIPLASAVAACMALCTLLIWILTENPVFESALRAITIGLCFLPTGISTIIRVYYVKGASDFISKRAVVKSLSDIEKLNSMTVLCVEKEGAISKSRFEVKDVYTKSEELLYKVAVLSCEKDSTDEVERALMVKATFFDQTITELYDKYKLVEKIPDSAGNIEGGLWDFGGHRLYCVKGSAEQILPLCRFKGDDLFLSQTKLKDYYKAGCRVIAFACADADETDVDATAGFSYTFVGFIAIAAPLRASVASAVNTCRRSGVRVVMLTEDNAPVAEATGKMIGLSGVTITGKQISQSVKTDNPLDYNADIYAKISSEQKLYIIDRMKKNGEVVAMTGTRATDAEALEMADIGITISQHTSGSAYESADIIMNDDDFTSIADTIAAARQIHRNIKRAVSALISGYVSLIILTVLNLFGNASLMLNPSIIALATMVIFPAIALSFVGDTSDMKTIMPPSKYVTDQTLNYPFIGKTAIIGLLTGAVSIASYLFMSNGNLDFARSCSFISFSICASLFGFAELSTDNPFRAAAAMKWKPVIIYALIILISFLLITIPGINSAFGFVAIDPLAMFISVITGVVAPIGYMIARSTIKFR